jgi:hypothetical protein
VLKQFAEEFPGDPDLLEEEESDCVEAMEEYWKHCSSLN